MKILFSALSFLIVAAGSSAVVRPAAHEIDERPVVVSLSRTEEGARDTFYDTCLLGNKHLSGGKIENLQLCFNNEEGKSYIFCPVSISDDDFPKLSGSEWEEVKASLFGWGRIGSSAAGGAATDRWTLMVKKIAEDLASFISQGKFNPENVLVVGDHELTTPVAQFLSKTGVIYEDEKARLAGIVSTCFPPLWRFEERNTVLPHAAIYGLDRTNTYYRFAFPGTSAADLANAFSKQDSPFSQIRYCTIQESCKTVSWILGVRKILTREPFHTIFRDPSFRVVYPFREGVLREVIRVKPMSEWTPDALVVSGPDTTREGVFKHRLFMEGESPRLAIAYDTLEGTYLYYAGYPLYNSSVKKGEWVYTMPLSERDQGMLFRRIKPNFDRPTSTVTLETFIQDERERPIRAGDVLEANGEKRVIIGVEPKEMGIQVLFEGGPLELNRPQAVTIHERGRHFFPHPILHTAGEWKRGWHVSENRFFVPHGDEAAEMFKVGSTVNIPGIGWRQITSYDISRSADGTPEFAHVGYAGEHIKADSVPHLYFTLDRESPFVNRSPVMWGKGEENQETWKEGIDQRARRFFVFNTQGNRDAWQVGTKHEVDEIGWVRIIEQIDAGDTLHLVYRPATID